MSNKWLPAIALVAGSIAFGGAANAVSQEQIEVLVDGSVIAPTVACVPGQNLFTCSYIDPSFSGISVTVSGAPSNPLPGFGTTTLDITTANLSASHTLEIITSQTGVTPDPTVGGLLSTFTYNNLSNPAGVTHAIGQNFTSTVGGGLTPFLKTDSIALTPDQGLTLGAFDGPILGAAPISVYSETEDWNFTFAATTDPLFPVTSVLTTDFIVGKPIPEPFSLALVGSGLIGLAFARARRR